MRVAQVEIDVLALDGGFEADALNLEFLHKTLADALDHIIDERAAQAVQRLGLRIVAIAAHDHVAALDFEGGAKRQCPVELAFGAFNRDLLAFDLHLDLGRNGYGLFSDA